MSNYVRVIPRDLFNEANLLKCLGRLWICLDENRDHQARFEQEDADFFDIVQDENGGIRVRNLEFTVGGTPFLLTRPLNSRRDWPLYVESEIDPDFEAIEVFDDKGNLSEEMLLFANGVTAPQPR